MSLPSYATPLRLELNPSVQLRRWLIVAHLGAATSLLVTPIHWSLAAIGLLLVLWSGLRARRRPEIQQNGHALVWGEGQRWQGELFNRGEAELIGGQTFGEEVVLLNFRSRKRHIDLTVMRDGLPADDFRRLRVRLRQLRGPTVAEAEA